MPEASQQNNTRYSTPKRDIETQFATFDSVVVIGTLGGRPQVLSTMDERQTQQFIQQNAKQLHLDTA